MERIAGINGQLMPEYRAMVPALDRGVLYGYGLFETMAVHSGRVLLVDRHLDRLTRSAPKLGLEITMGQDEIINMITGVITANRIDEGYLRLTLTAGSVAPGPPLQGSVFVQARSGIPYGRQQYQNGVAAGICAVRRNDTSPLVNFKTLNYLDNLLAREESRQRGWVEGLLLNTRGHLAEGTASNLFLVLRGRLVTPDAESGLLPGIIRQVVLELAGEVTFPCEERQVSPEELFLADEVFLTNSLMGIMPLTLIDGRPVGDGMPGPVTAKLAELVVSRRASDVSNI